jgi:nondiscriminating aspartyl-tRNA synthetase
VEERVGETMRVWSTELSEHVGERVQLRGWLLNHRALSRVDFVILRDGQGVCQIVVNDPAQRSEAAQWLDETVFEVEGTPKLNAQAPGGVELVDPDFRLLVPTPEPPPVNLRVPELKEQLPFQLDHAAVALRHPRRRAMFRLGAMSLAGMRATLDAAGFTEIQTPKIVASATETGANVFRLDYFGRPGYLAQSPQFYKQMMVGVFERVYEIGPVFRAEPHDTVRHLAEYVSLDVELGFIDDHFTVMGVVRDVFAGMVARMQEQGAAELELLELTLPDVPEQIPHIDFVAAQELIERETGETGVVGEPDLAPAHERFLGEWAQREHGSDFVFVVGYPMSKRPFYTHPNPERPEYSNSFDLLFRGLELVTGGQRLHRYEEYVKVLEAAGQSLEPYESYLEAFKFGMPAHGGFAIGWERWMARLIEASNIRETTIFPRDINRIQP